MTSGIQIAQQGVPIDDAADYQLVLDSRWPLLEIYIEKEIDVTLPVPPNSPDTSAFAMYYTYELLTHDLGFPPAWEFYVDPDVPLSDPVTFDSVIIRVTNKRVFVERLVFLDGSTGAPSSPSDTTFHVKGKVLIYKNNILNEYQSTAFTPEGRGIQERNRYGVKVLTEETAATAMSDDDYRNFALNTEAKAMGIHKTGLTVANAATSNIATIQHGLGYLPTFMIYQYIADPDYGVLSGGIEEPRLEGVRADTRATNTTLTFRGVQAALVGTYAYLIFKDPILESV